MSLKRYDVVIVGAGIAGASLAYFLGKEGVKTLLVDMKPYSRAGDKPCGDALGKHHFDELGIEYPKGRELEGVVKGIDIYSPYEDVRYRVLGEGFEVNRIALTQRFIDKAVELSVEYLDLTYALKPILKNRRVSGVELWSKGKGTWIVESSVVVDATGLARAIVRHLPRDWPINDPIKPEETNIAYREVRILAKDIEDMEILRIYINKSIAPGGYWWFFPYSLVPGKVNVGLGVQGGMNCPNPKTLLYKHVLSRPEFKDSRIVEAGGAAVPTRRPVTSLVWDGIGVIGDAAYTANPIHGGGKGSAMISSYCLSKALIDALSKTSTPSAQDLWSANICYLNMYGVKQAMLDIFRIFLQRLSNDELEYGMKKKLIKEEDLNILSLKGDLELSVVEKAMRLLSGLRKPSLLFKLRSVAKYMNIVKNHYKKYPEEPSGIWRWFDELRLIYEEFMLKISR